MLLVYTKFRLLGDQKTPLATHVTAIRSCNFIRVTYRSLKSLTQIIDKAGYSINPLVMLRTNANYAKRFCKREQVSYTSIPLPIVPFLNVFVLHLAVIRGLLNVQ